MIAVPSPGMDVAPRANCAPGGSNTSPAGVAPGSTVLSGAVLPPA